MKTRIMPPTARTSYAAAMADQAGLGLALQKCGDCEALQYPPRELCRVCLSDALSWQPVKARGRLLCRVELHHSFSPWFSDRLPWSLVSVALCEGVTLLCHGHPAVVESQSERQTDVAVQLVKDPGGAGVLVALPDAVDQIFQSLEDALTWQQQADQEINERDS